VLTLTIAKRKTGTAANMAKELNATHGVWAAGWAPILKEAFHDH
jgi:hypothetical protein